MWGCSASLRSKKSTLQLFPNWSIIVTQLDHGDLDENFEFQMKMLIFPHEKPFGTLFGLRKWMNFMGTSWFFSIKSLWCPSSRPVSPAFGSPQKVWVPSHFGLEQFVSSGVLREKMVVVPEAWHFQLGNMMSWYVMVSYIILDYEWLLCHVIRLYHLIFYACHFLIILYHIIYLLSYYRCIWCSAKTYDTVVLISAPTPKHHQQHSQTWHVCVCVFFPYQNQAVDTDLFNPRVEPLEVEGPESGGYRFLSVFKWEKRKGWDILLRAYFEAGREKSLMADLWGDCVYI